MIKLLLWIGAPSVFTFFVSVYAAQFETIFILFVLSAVALALGLVPRVPGRQRRLH